MSKTKKKIISDISNFFPQPDQKVKYVEGTDYNEEVLTSPFTLSNCLELADKIASRSGEGTYATINYEARMLPLVLTLLLDSNISYMFIYTYKDEGVQMLINNIILLDLGDKCELRDSGSADIDASGLLYIGVDDKPLTAPKGRKEYGTVLIKTSALESGITLSSKNKEKEEIGPFKLFIAIRDENFLSDPTAEKKFKKRHINKFNEKDYKRLPLKEKKKDKKKEESSEDSDKKKSSKKKKKDKKKEESSESNKKKGSKKKKKEESSDDSDKKKSSKKKKKDREKEESSEPDKKKKKDKKKEEASEPDKKKKKESSSGGATKVKEKSVDKDKSKNKKREASSEHEDKSKSNEEFVIGDRNVYTVKPNHKNIKQKDKAPKKGGWLEEFNGIMTFYVMGGEKLPKPDENIGKSSTKFQSKFHDYLQQLLGLFVVDKGDIDELTRDEFMPMWLQTWTHRTYDIDANYETLELVGDTCLSFGFVSFMCNKDPHLNERELTTLKSASSDKSALRQISWELGMDSWLRMGLGAKSTSNTAEDVVEAFCNTLHMVGTAYLEGEGDKKVSYILGSGIKYFQQFVEFLYGPIIFPPSIYLSDAKTMLLQAAEAIVGEIGVNRAIQETTTRGEGGNEYTYTLTLSWTDKAMKFFKDNKDEDFMKHLKGKKIDKHIVTVKAGSKKGTAPKAYRKAIEELAKRGITIDWLNGLKYINKWKDFDEKLVSKALKKVHDKYGDESRLELNTPKGLGTNLRTTVMLLAIIPDGSRRGKNIILGGGTGSDIVELKNKVLKEYANS